MAENRQPLAINTHVPPAHSNPPSSLSGKNSIQASPLSSTSRTPTLVATPATSHSHPSLSSTPASPSSPSASRSKSETLKSAYAEARHFAGGLIAHPTSSTTHYTILRHSHGLVYYRGSSTSLALSIFSSPSHPLPLNRTYHLQRRGYTGAAGLRVGTWLRGASGWLDVTPAQAVRDVAREVDPADERAWQRDIARFRRKAENGGKHVLRETVVLRIPVEVENGYLRVVLCGTEGGRKRAEGSRKSEREKTSILCASPLFRVASAAPRNPGTVRGAPLAMMPLELGAKVARPVMLAAATSALGPAAQSARTAVASKAPAAVEAYQTYGGVAKTSAQVAAAPAAEAADFKLHLANREYRHRRRDMYRAASVSAAEAEREFTDAARVSAAGPSAPYPVDFGTKVVPGTGRAAALFGMPTANLEKLPEEVRLRVPFGHYFGWARLKGSKRCPIPEMAVPDGDERLRRDGLSHWFQALITVRWSGERRVRVSGEKEKLCCVYMVHDFDDGEGNGRYFMGVEIEVKMMGYLRPVSDEEDDARDQGEGALADATEKLETDKEIGSGPGLATAEEELLRLVDDVAVTQTALERPGWGPLGKEPSERRPASSLQDKAGETSEYRSRSNSPSVASERGLEISRERSATWGGNGPNPQQQQQPPQRKKSLQDRWVGARMGVQKRVDSVPLYKAGVRTDADRVRDKAVGGRGGYYITR